MPALIALVGSPGENALFDTDRAERGHIIADKPD
jgi:hypothetical protein